MLRFLKQYWFLVALVLILLAGFGFHATLSPWTELVPRRAIVAGVLFVMALPLDLSTMWRALRYPGPVFLSVAINYGVLPPLAWLAADLLPSELGTGLIVMAAIPCTLASASVWTRRAGGNDAVTILVTILTNLACFLVTPFWVRLLTSRELAIDVTPMATRLALLVVLPILAAQLLRMYRPAAAWATTRKLALGVVAQVGVLLMIALGVVRSGVELNAQADSTAFGLMSWLLMLGLVVLLHLTALMLGHLIAAGVGMHRADRIAVGFGGSQKTLMVGLDVGLEFFNGLAILPMVAYQVAQLLADTVIADRLRRRERPPLSLSPEVCGQSVKKR